MNKCAIFKKINPLLWFITMGLFIIFLITFCIIIINDPSKVTEFNYSYGILIGAFVSWLLDGFTNPKLYYCNAEI